MAVDLSKSTVDSKSLGLKGAQAIGISGTDIGSGSATTTVQQIVSDTTNTSSLATAGFTDFYFRGPGFSDNDYVKVSVNVSGVADTSALVTNINNAVSSAANRFLGAGLSGPIDPELDTVSGTTTVAQVVADLSNKISANTQLQAAGITLDAHASAAALTFRSKHGEQFEVQVSGDTGNRLGLGTFRSANAVTGGFDYTTIDGTGATFAAGTTQTLEFSISGGTTQSLTIAATEAATVGAAIAYLNDEFQTNATLRAAGLVASDTGGGQIRIASANGTYFRVNGIAAGATNQLGFGVVGVASTANYASTLTSKHTFNAGGSSNTALGNNDEVFNWTALRNGSDDQTISFTTTEASGAEHSLAVVLRNDSTLSCISSFKGTTIETWRIAWESTVCYLGRNTGAGSGR